MIVHHALDEADDRALVFELSDDDFARSAILCRQFREAAARSRAQCATHRGSWREPGFREALRQRRTARCVERAARQWLIGWALEHWQPSAEGN